MKVYLSLGSNIRPLSHLMAALERLAGHDAIRLVGESPWYETRPWGGIVQANFVNLVCAVETTLPLPALLRVTQGIEHRLGRERRVRNGPRTIDIDILLAGEEVYATTDLRVPHPGLLERDFMLIPLLDLAPLARFPGTGERLMDKVSQLLYRQIIRTAMPNMNPIETDAMHIWVDADACPAVIKEILFRAAARVAIPVTLVANQPLHTPPSPLIRSVQVGHGFDVADHYIVDNLRAGDLVITADIPLAAQVIEKGGEVIDPRGERYTAENIRERLALRDFMEELRSAGEVTGGPPPLSKSDRQAFANALDRLLTRQRL